MGQSCCPAEPYVTWQWLPGATDDVRVDARDAPQPPRSRPGPLTALTIRRRLRSDCRLCITRDFLRKRPTKHGGQGSRFVPFYLRKNLINCIICPTEFLDYDSF